MRVPPTAIRPAAARRATIWCRSAARSTTVARLTKRYAGYNLTDTSYANASSVTSDTILEQAETSIDAASNAIQETTRSRYHNATGTGELGSPASTQPKARVTYVATWPDAL